MYTRKGRDMSSILKGQGFGNLKITRNGVTVEVPSNWLFKDGRIKKQYVEELNSKFVITA